MRSFTKHIQDFQINIPVYRERLNESRSRRIRVAIIDDGFDGTFNEFKDITCYGHSFLVRELTYRANTVEQAQPFFYSSTGHGTLMARLIAKMCPWLELYIVRLNHGMKDGMLHPDGESASKVGRPTPRFHCGNLTF